MTSFGMDPVGYVKRKIGWVDAEQVKQPKKQTYSKPAPKSTMTNLQIQQQAWDKAAKAYMTGQNNWNQNATMGVNAALAMQGPERYQMRMNQLDAQRDVERANLQAASTGGAGTRANEIAALEYRLGQENAKGDMASILRASALKDQLLALRNQEREGSKGLITQAMRQAEASKNAKMQGNELGRKEANLNAKMNTEGIRSNATGNFFAPGRLMEEQAQTDILSNALANYGLADDELNREYAGYIRDAEEKINQITRDLLADTGKTNEEREQDAEKIRQIQRGQELAFAQMNAAKAGNNDASQMAKWNAAVAANRANEQKFYTALVNNSKDQQAWIQGIAAAGNQPKPPPPARPGAGVKVPTSAAQRKQQLAARKNR